MADSCSTSIIVSSSSSKGSTRDAQGGSTTSSDCESHPIVSLLERLWAPSASELGRKRKIDANPAPPKGKKHSTQSLRKFDPKSVRPSQRVNEFCGEKLSESIVSFHFTHVFSDYFWCFL